MDLKNSSIFVHRCDRPTEVQFERKHIVAATVFLILSIFNILSHTLLITVIVYNWRSVFSKYFIYRLIIVMSWMACAYSFLNLITIVPCTYMGCLFYSSRVLSFLVSYLEAFEYGFYYAIFFISIDRFLTFYLPKFNAMFRQPRSIVLIFILCFLSYGLPFFIGCGESYFPEELDTKFCDRCWISKSHRISYETIVENSGRGLSVIMSFFYILIALKIAAMHQEIFKGKRQYSNTDIKLALQFFVLCGVQVTGAILNYTIFETDSNWVGSIILSMPLTIQFINAFLLLVCNSIIRKGIKQLVRLDNNNSKIFITGIDASKNPKWAVLRPQKNCAK